jgi:triosephosphate isomerase
MLRRKKIVAANWKMNLTSSEVQPYFETLQLEINQVEGVDIVLIPSFTSIPKASELLEKAGGIVHLGAQNLSAYDQGAFTGEISARMLRDLFVRYVLVGHSERRQLFAETDQMIHEKMVTAHRTEIRPILCVGETLEERKAGRAEQVLERQLTTALSDLSPDNFSDTIIAYEPIWAIGTGSNATPEEAIEMHRFIRQVLKNLTSKEVAANMRLQYGGSVTPTNARELLKSSHIDGVLVGGASLDPRSFAQIVKAASRNK